LLLRLPGDERDSAQCHHHVERIGIGPDRLVGNAGPQQCRERASDEPAGLQSLALIGAQRGLEGDRHAALGGQEAEEGLHPRAQGLHGRPLGQQVGHQCADPVNFAAVDRPDQVLPGGEPAVDRPDAHARVLRDRPHRGVGTVAGKGAGGRLEHPVLIGLGVRAQRPVLLFCHCHLPLLTIMRNGFRILLMYAELVPLRSLSEEER